MFEPECAYAVLGYFYDPDNSNTSKVPRTLCKVATARAALRDCKAHRHNKQKRDSSKLLRVMYGQDTPDLGSEQAEAMAELHQAEVSNNFLVVACRVLAETFGIPPQAVSATAA